MARMTLEEFLASPMRDAFIRYRDLEAYVRRSVRLIDGERKNALDRAHTKNKKRGRSNNMMVNPNITRTGQYRELDDLMKRLAVEHGFDGVYVENVLNDFLPDKLKEWGYRHINADDPYSKNTPCFWWQPERNDG